MFDRLNAYSPQVLAILRIVVALLFIMHGTQKLFGFPAGGSQPEVFSLLGLAAILEAFGGLAVLLGLFTRPIAFILSGEMAVAYWMVHAPNAALPINNGGEPAVLFCFVFLYFVFAGPGAWSLDQMRAAAPRIASP